MKWICSEVYCCRWFVEFTILSKALKVFGLFIKRNSLVKPVAKQRPLIETLRLMDEKDIESLDLSLKIPSSQSNLNSEMNTGSAPKALAYLSLVKHGPTSYFHQQNMWQHTILNFQNI